MAMPIEKGDKVRLYFNSNVGHSMAWIVGEVLHMPSDTGDLIYIKDENGNTQGFNPNSAGFDSIFKEG